MCDHLLCSRSENTCKSYSNGFKKWQRVISVQGHSALPAHPVHIALYLTHLLDSGASSNTVNLAVYCIKWVHGLNGYSDPTDNSFVKNLQESAKRRAKPKTCRKDPVTPEILIKLCEMFKSSSDVLVVRDLPMTLLSFAGFLKYDEISSVCCQDVKIFDGYFSIKITKQRRGYPTTPSCSTHSKTPKHPMQKHKADKHKKRRARDKERQRTTQKHQTQRTTHKPTRPMDNRCRLRTAICHENSRRYGYPGLRAHNPPIFPITQRSRRTYNCGVKQPPHCQMTTHKQDRKRRGPSNTDEYVNGYKKRVYVIQSVLCRRVLMYVITRGVRLTFREDRWSGPCLL
ncbi:hypothetical protein FSP39_017560 [Pinctada imbricata]|uniref:Integrase SAM-like N-terminal domain-containing protein n=1 Tax=Pinctada imbricata TaxID=66713 RepID=A0AA88YM09_PINIB|nr:hypothetical protein FSP39_017560 [Pinctada imbricata]